MRLKTKQKKMGINLARVISSRSIPLSLKKELENFVKRNSIKHTETFCPNCLKAHALKKAQEFNISKDIFNKISESIEDVGHNGYYLDRNKLLEFNL